MVLHRRLRACLTTYASNGSHILYTMPLASQLQATVKFHGVFASHWKSLVFPPEGSVRRSAVGDSGDLITPFMHVTNQMTRHYAHICYFPCFQVLTTNLWWAHISIRLLASLQGSDCIFTIIFMVSGVQSLRILDTLNGLVYSLSPRGEQCFPSPLELSVRAC